MDEIRVSNVSIMTVLGCSRWGLIYYIVGYRRQLPCADGYNPGLFALDIGKCPAAPSHHPHPFLYRPFRDFLFRHYIYRFYNGVSVYLIDFLIETGYVLSVSIWYRIKGLWQQSFFSYFACPRKRLMVFDFIPCFHVTRFCSQHIREALSQLTCS